MYYRGLASGMRTCSGRMPIPINQAGMRRRAGKNPEELEKQRWFRPPLAFENAANDPPLDGELQPLCKADREGAAVLDRPQIVVP